MNEISAMSSDDTKGLNGMIDWWEFRHALPFLFFFPFSVCI